MSIPSKMYSTSQASVTVAEGEATDASSEFWQRVAGNVFVVFTGVPYALAQNIIQSADPDTAIKTLLVGYPKRVAAV